ncbi:hypothetical protein [Pediococcus cellicola]|uniref:IpaB EvcA family protein n=1 Tax=Pediococcus cellicola TaxID=319652 RepID=A0A0R2ILP3_9LACO|nr:hypothetical protein [Pediococcus cellicola]KRN65848.1 hypothetical protein IV80_GL001687 [Pediococcus cellicola]GEL15662.1 hypothetical protein PCE01_14640 [Pediococcus cellicola]
MSEIQLSEEVQKLLAQVKEATNEKIVLDYGDQKSGFVRYDQSYQTRQDQQLVLHIRDITAPDYTVSHELLHALMDLKKYPAIHFNLTSGHQDFDEQLMIITTTLYDTATHLQIYRWQEAHHLLTEAVRDAYLKGVVHTIKPEEEGKVDGMMHLRLMTILDALVFYGDQFEQVASQFEHDYPMALEGAKNIYQILMQKPVDSPFTLRRTLVKLYAAFDQQLEKWHLPVVGSSEFVTVDSVLSRRQLRLEVRQLFQISHSELQEQATQKRAYIGLGMTDRQNAFVLPAPPKSQSEVFFKQLYDMSVAEFFEKFHLTYTIR